MADADRPTLGALMSVTCFHFLRAGAEESAGRALIVTAGRERGQDIVKSLGLEGKVQSADEIQKNLAKVLGIDGTRLCLVQKIVAKDNGGFEVHITEGACTAGVTNAPEPHCAFTMGVFIGSIAHFTGKRMTGKETMCSGMGAAECVYQIDPLD
ncbi:4-vinyl reductase [Candidatus Oscillochloris fontis]|uniref:4-vinyl reductase n=1 Tax=Candidatus Oscillochloris fontis TaxID=2496868 RepID=UPI00101B7A1B|nr:4-vinyl reductase [Candidatus Oscillochloris fontis]